MLNSKNFMHVQDLKLIAEMISGEYPFHKDLSKVFKMLDYDEPIASFAV